MRGYNVYRDGRLITPEPVSATTFHDPREDPAGTRDAVYDRASRALGCRQPDPQALTRRGSPALKSTSMAIHIVIGGASAVI